MPITCSVSRCQKCKLPGTSFHRIPSGSESAAVREKWIQFIRRARDDPTWSPHKYSSICSHHFDPGSILETERRGRHLHKGTIPTIWDIGPGFEDLASSSRLNNVTLMRDVLEMDSTLTGLAALLIHRISKRFRRLNVILGIDDDSSDFIRYASPNENDACPSSAEFEEVDVEWDLKPPTSAISSQLIASEGGSDKSETEQISSHHGSIKIVDIRNIIGQSEPEAYPDHPEVKLELEPIQPIKHEHTCPHCAATFGSAQALSMHDLIHAKVCINRLAISQQSIELYLSDPNRYCIREFEQQLYVVRKLPSDCIKLPGAIQTGSQVSKNLTNLPEFTVAHPKAKACDVCTEMCFKTNQERNLHFRTAHPDLNLRHRYKCERCDRSFPFKHLLQYHVRQGHPDPNQVSMGRVCGEVCESQQTIGANLQSNHLASSLAVPSPTLISEMHEETTDALRYHMLASRRKHLRQVCGFRGRTEYQLKYHENTVHSTKRPHKCPHCPDKFKGKAELRQHIFRHFGKDVKACPHCGREQIARNLAKHINTVHRGRKLKCGQCPAMYCMRYDLKNHYLLEHPRVIVPPLTEIEVIYTKTKKPECERVMKTVSAPPPPPRRYKCPHCPMTLKGTIELKRHVDIHLGRNMKPCPHCGKDKISRTLASHIDTVHRGKRLKCGLCPTMYGKRNRLRIHYARQHPTVTIPSDSEFEIVYTKIPEVLMVTAEPTHVLSEYRGTKCVPVKRLDQTVVPLSVADDEVTINKVRVERALRTW